MPTHKSTPDLLGRKKLKQNMLSLMFNSFYAHIVVWNYRESHSDFDGLPDWGFCDEQCSVLPDK